MDKLLLNTILDEVSEDYPAVLITIIKSTGSTPRGVGAQMIVFKDGRTVGTIGGGCGEAEVKRQAFISMDSNQPEIFTVQMNSDLAADEGMVCGGIMDVLIDPIADKKLYASLSDELEKGIPTYFITNLSNIEEKIIIDDFGKKLFGNGAELPLAEIIDETNVAIKTINGSSYLVIPVNPEEKLLILGAGHVGHAVAELAKNLDFKITVVDDRPDFANRTRFPNVEQVICADFAKTLADIKIDKNTYIVIVTRGHQYDEVCLKQVLGKRAKYLGMIGSKRRVKLLLSKLSKEGFPQDDLDKIKSPIGLKIGAETPAEIGICILGEIIAVRRSCSV